MRIPASVRALRKPVLPRGIDPDEPARGGYHVRAGTEERISDAPARRPEKRVARALELWRAEARDRAQRAPQQNYYEVLGLEQGCTNEDVERAYETLSKRFDPAELPAEISDAIDDAASVVEHARRAFEMLSEENTRADYDRALENGLGVRPAVRKGMLAEACYRRAESLLKRRDYAGAMCEVERALSQGGSCARYEALFGFLQHLRGGAGAGGKAHPLALQHLDLALKQDPRCEQAHHYMAIVQKQLGNKERAIEHFQRALKLNPGNLEAAREVRLHNLRARDRSPSGLMKRLFGKSS
jgi:tetratricopeptide (TPR) repeat protein